MNEAPPRSRRSILPRQNRRNYVELRNADVPRGGKMDWSVVREKIAKHGMRNSNVLAIAPTNIEKSTIDVKKEQRGVMATQTAATAVEAKQYTAAEKNACSIDAMLIGGMCEACQ